MFNNATTPAPRPPRHALGLPAGSVRAILALTVLGLLWLIALKFDTTKSNVTYVFLDLNILMMLILAHFFSVHGHTIGSEDSPGSPLHLPRGSVRLILLLGYAGMAYFLYQHRSEFQIPSNTRLSTLIILIAVLLGGFFIGHYLTMIVKFCGGGTLPFWFQDVQAWVALMSMLALAILAIVHIFINTSVPPEMEVTSHPIDTALAALVGFYFGSRS
jgi:hypothetical protein